ncbi:MAG: D-glycero-beta-D-manno-heptose-7-phosphate kinase [Calditrichia bacterium]
MIHISSRRLGDILSLSSRKRIMVIGDLMLDRYLWGQVTRISPEAPVPIINIEDDEVRFGGAANVANNIVGLGAEPVLVGTIGDDNGGEIFRRLLAEKKLTAAGLIVDSSRPTTIKTRIIGNDQQIARVDREKTHSISTEVQDRILQQVRDLIVDVDAIILQDYNKGMMLPGLIKGIVEIAGKADTIVTVDPKFDHFLEYRGVTLFKPNRKETEEALVMRLDSDEAVCEAGSLLLKELSAKAVLITLSERGVALFERDEEPVFTHTRARKVADVSGAGDTVIAAVTVALAAGASFKEAVSMANYAAGVVCGEVGVVPITRAHLMSAFEQNTGD